MPVDWRPQKRIQTFINQRCYARQIKRREYYQGRVFNDKGVFIEQNNRSSYRDIYEVEGTLEVQRQLLSKLAAYENQVIAESSSNMHYKPLQALKADTLQAVQKTWNQSSRSATCQRLLYALD